MTEATGFSNVDYAAFAFYALAWVLHLYVVNHSPLRLRTISYRMRDYRKLWMSRVVERGGSPVDALMQNSLQQGVLFFASTSVLLIGGLAAGFGAADRAVVVLGDLPWVEPSTPAQWEIKLLLVLLLLVFAFFKFAWSYRLFNYVVIVMGASPPGDAPQVELDAHVSKLAELHALAASHFTSGVHAYFFALSAIAWFLGPWPLVAATVWVSLILYRRAFLSKFLSVLNQ